MKDKDIFLLALEDSMYFLTQSILMLEYERLHALDKCICNFEKLKEINEYILGKIDKLLDEEKLKISEYHLVLESDWKCKKDKYEILRFDLLQAFWSEYQNNGFTLFQLSTDYFEISYQSLKGFFFIWTQEVFRQFPEHVQHLNILATQHNLRSMNKLYSIEDYFVELYVSYHLIYQRVFQQPHEIYRILNNINHIAPFKDLTYGGNDFSVLKKKSSESDYLIGLQVPVKAQSNMIDVLHKVFLQMISMLLNKNNDVPSETQLQQAVEIATSLLTLQKRNHYPLTQRKSPLKTLEALLYQSYKKKHPTKNSNDFMQYLEQLFIEKGLTATRSKSKTYDSNRRTPVNTNDLTLTINIQNFPLLNELKKSLASEPRTDKIDKIFKHIEQHSKIEICFGSVRKNAVNIPSRYNEYFAPKNKGDIVKIYQPASKKAQIATVSLQNLYDAEAGYSIEQMLKNIEERRL